MRTKEELFQAGWHQVSTGARKGMWRFSNGKASLLLADYSHPDDEKNKALLEQACFVNAEGKEKLSDESPKGFITAPTLDQLRPTKREQHLLKALWDWQERSKKTTLILGQPTKERSKEQ